MNRSRKIKKNIKTKKFFYIFVSAKHKSNRVLLLKKTRIFSPDKHKNGDRCGKLVGLLTSLKTFLFEGSLLIREKRTLLLFCFVIWKKK
ncbi:hypothetical protein A2335_01625 [Candidatus Peregrinibacteria bacterium RIFOXYB2_FULL_32_7]|nr:MAG: hypothetical protein A2335_01625 [Candidatus Peregrinibacteria bacterium RIFOXYB2_FULL_32_7]